MTKLTRAAIADGLRDLGLQAGMGVIVHSSYKSFGGVEGGPEAVILEAARERSADLIVMGTHGRTGLAHVFLGSVAERVVREADCPVVTTRA